MRRRIPVTETGDGASRIQNDTKAAAIDGQTVVSNLSISHIAELIALEEPTQSAFY